MAVFIEATTDPFAARRQRDAESFRAEFLNYGNVRRPTRGYQLKEESYAIIRVMKSNGDFLSVLDQAGEMIYEQDGKGYTTFYSNFFVQSVQEQRQEKQQIIETFGDSYIFFFGESPRLLTVQGMLLNTADFQWKAEWWENYERFFRGTKLVEQGARLFLIYDEVMIEGYIISAQATEQNEVPQVIPFGFQMFVTGYTNMITVGDPNYPTNRDSVYGSVSSAGLDAQQQDAAASDRALASEAVAESDGEAGSGRLLADGVRDGTVDPGDPSTAAAVEATEEREGSTGFSTPGSGTIFNDNVDEFVQRGLNLRGIPLREMPTDEEWEQAAAATDSAVEESVVPDENGEVVDTTSEDYYDTMGRSGHAADEMNASGGNREAGQGIRRDLGGSDLGDSERSTGSPSGRRSVPYGLQPMPGELA